MANRLKSWGPGRIFFGWWTVLAAGIMAGLEYGICSYGFSTYFKPLKEEFGWTRAQISTGYALGRAEGGVEGLFGGYFIDKYGPRLVCIIGTAIAGVGLILMYFINSFWQFLVVWGVTAAMGTSIGGFESLEAAITKWFVRKRGLAIGLERCLFASLAAAVVPFMAFLIFGFGWRKAFLIAGSVTLAIGIPLVWFCVRPRRPEYYGLMPDGAKAGGIKEEAEAVIEAGVEYAGEVGEVEFTLRQLLRTRVFWLLTSSWVFYGLAWSIVQLHQVPYLTGMGIDPIAAAQVLGLTVFVSAPGRLLGGILADRFSTKRLKYLLIIPSFFQILALLIFMRATSLGMVYLFAILFGFMMGVRYSLSPLIRARFFGRKAFATTQGVTGAINLPASVFFPIYVGWMYDITGSYAAVLIQGLALLIIGTIMLFFLDPPKPPAKITKITEFI